MPVASPNPFTTLLIGFLAGAGTLIFVMGRMDRSGDSGCFYVLLQILVIVLAAAILIAASGG